MTSETDAMIALFDTETTGIEDGAQIIESALGFIDPRIAPLDVHLLHMPIHVERFKPSVRIELGAMATHHIIEQDVESCRPSSAFAFPPHVALMIGHNVNFDWKMAGRPKVKRICTLALARKVWPELDAHSLGAILYSLLPHPQAQNLLQNAHSAAVDVENLLRVLTALCAELKPATWAELYHMSENARVPEIITFGKHKDSRIADLPRDYRDWMLRQKDMDPYVLVAVRRSFGLETPMPRDDEL